MSPKRPRLLPAYLLGGLMVLVAALASLPVVEETAAVRVAAPPQRLDTNVLINLPASHIDAEIKDSDGVFLHAGDGPGQRSHQGAALRAPTSISFAMVINIVEPPA